MTTNFDASGYWHDTDALADGNVLVAETDGQRWHLSWHPPPAIPDGRNEGSSGICIASEGGIVLVSPDTITWYLPGGRPEGAESREETLRREVHEEACATVSRARLLGYARSCCVEGREAGVALVRAFWRAEVQLDPWAPQFEMTLRQVVPASEVIHLLHRSSDQCFAARSLRPASRSALLMPHLVRPLSHDQETTADKERHDDQAR